MNFSALEYELLWISLEADPCLPGARMQYPANAGELRS